MIPYDLLSRLLRDRKKILFARSYNSLRDSRVNPSIFFSFSVVCGLVVWIRETIASDSILLLLPNIIPNTALPFWSIFVLSYLIFKWTGPLLKLWKARLSMFCNLAIQCHWSSETTRAHWRIMLKKVQLIGSASLSSIKPSLLAWDASILKDWRNFSIPE